MFMKYERLEHLDTPRRIIGKTKTHFYHSLLSLLPSHHISHHWFLVLEKNVFMVYEFESEDATKNQTNAFPIPII